MTPGKTLYLECRTGISGDMTVAALLDLGADREGLLRALAGLGVAGYEIRISRTSRNGVAGCDFTVQLAEDIHHHSEGCDERKNGRHMHGHGHGRSGHEHIHMHRNLHDIIHIIEGAGLSPEVATIARRAFAIVAEAEAKAHGIPIDEVHFHEVGAVDSIVDIVSAAYCLDNLGIETVIVPDLSEGNGTVRCQHGILPVPVPAVANIASAYGIALRIVDVDTEMVTPTGAAIVAATRTDDRLPETFKIEKIGVGLGKRDLGRPNFLRAMLIRPE